MYVCLCKGITEADIQELGRVGCVEPAALASALGIDQDVCCKRCIGNINELVTIAVQASAEVMA